MRIDGPSRSLMACSALGLLLTTSGAARGFELALATDEAHDAGQVLTVEHEVVALTFVRASAGFDNVLAWDGTPTGAGFRCRDVPPGFTMLVGRFPERTELQLSLATPRGDLWRTGDDNADLVAHARLTPVAPDTVLVEWEDLGEGGDLDYDDCVVSLSITPLAP